MSKRTSFSFAKTDPEYRNEAAWKQKMGRPMRKLGEGVPLSSMGRRGLARPAGGHVLVAVGGLHVTKGA